MGLGGSSDPLYDGQYFVEQHEDIVVVSLNYRVGFMGFIDFKNVEGGEDFAQSGNLGLLDNVQALKWVEDNIEAFGGDPENVTIFGESAGGSITSHLLTMDEAEGLFDKCISQSETVVLSYDQAEVDSWGLTEKLMEVTGAKNMDDLMAIPEEDLIKYYIEPFDDQGTTLNDLFLMPIRDGEILPADPIQAIADGAGKDIPLMIGTTANEWNYWLQEVGAESMEEAIPLYERYIVDNKIGLLKRNTNEEDLARIDQFMGLQTDKEELWAKTELLNELVFRVPAIQVAEAHSDAGGTSYMYYFAKESDAENLKACHASEVAYVFHNLTGAGFSGEMDEGLADDMSMMWANFARTGDPSIDDFTWTPYDSKTRETAIIGNDSSLKMESDPMPEQRELVEPLVEKFKRVNPNT